MRAHRCCALTASIRPAQVGIWWAILFSVVSLRLPHLISSASPQVGILWAVAVVELVFGLWLAYTDTQHKAAMRKQIEELEQQV